MIRSYDVYWESDKDSDKNLVDSFESNDGIYKNKDYSNDINFEEDEKEYLYRDDNYTNTNNDYIYNIDGGTSDIESSYYTYENDKYRPVESKSKFVRGNDSYIVDTPRNVNVEADIETYDKKNRDTKSFANIKSSSYIRSNKEDEDYEMEKKSYSNEKQKNYNSRERNNYRNRDMENYTIEEHRDTPIIERVQQIRHEEDKAIPKGYYEISSKAFKNNGASSQRKEKRNDFQESDLYFEDFVRSNAQCNHISVNEVRKCVKSNSIEFSVGGSDSDVRRDLVLENRTFIRIWGQIKDSYGNSVDNAIVSLLKPEYLRGNLDYLCTATTMTDSKGFYQFDLENDNEDTLYRIIVTKPAK